MNSCDLLAWTTKCPLCGSSMAATTYGKHCSYDDNINNIEHECLIIGGDSNKISILRMQCLLFQLDLDFVSNTVEMYNLQTKFLNTFINTQIDIPKSLCEFELICNRLTKLSLLK